MSIRCTECRESVTHPQGMAGGVSLANRKQDELIIKAGFVVCLPHVEAVASKLHRQIGEIEGEEVYVVDECQGPVYDGLFGRNTLSLFNPLVKTRTLGYLSPAKTLVYFPNTFYEIQADLGKAPPRKSEQEPLEIFMSREFEEAVRNETGMSPADYALKTWGKDCPHIRFITS